MIIGFAPYGRGGSGPALDYLTGYLVNGEARDPKPEVLRGDPKAVAEIIDSLPFQCRYSSGVLSFSAEDRVTPEMQEDIMNRFESAVFAGIPPDRRSIVWIKHSDKGRHEMHFVVARVDLGTGKSLNIAPPTPASRHLLDTLRELINRRYGFSDPSDPECSRTVSLPAHVAKLAAQAKRHGRSEKVDIRQTIAERVQEQAEAGTIQSRADVVDFLKNQGFAVVRAGVNYLTVARPDTGERVRLKGNLFRENFCPRDLQHLPRRSDPAQFLALDRRLERLVEKRASYHRARYEIKEDSLEPAQIKEHPIYDRTRNTPSPSVQGIGATISPARPVIGEFTGRFVEAAHRWGRSDRNLELATVGFERTNRAFADRFERTLMTAGVNRRTMVIPFQYPGATQPVRSVTLPDLETDLEPEMEVEF
jgi:chorismate mutase